MNFFGLTDGQVSYGMWLFSGGAIVVLLQSIMSGDKRNWWSLVTGCILGGAGAWIAGQIWADSRYIYIICGVAAVATEHLLSGVANASRQFADQPIKILTHMARTFLPTFGKGVGDTADNIDMKDVK